MLFAVRARWSLRPFWLMVMALLIIFIVIFIVWLNEPMRGAELLPALLRTGLVAVGFVAVALTGLAAQPHPYALVEEPEIKAAS